MNSLEQLNNYAGSPVAFVDHRVAMVVFDRTTEPASQVIRANVADQFFTSVTPGIEITDIINQTATISYTLDFTNYPTGTTLSWATSLPSTVTLTVSPARHYTVSNITLVQEWDAVKSPDLFVPGAPNVSCSAKSTISYSSTLTKQWATTLIVNPQNQLTAPLFDTPFTINANTVLTGTPTVTSL